MLDFKLERGDAGLYDLQLDSSGQIDTVEDFTTAITVSLFSDARAGETEVSLPEFRRGWIGDLALPAEGRKYGSLLWLLQQERLTQTTLNRAVDYARLALQWLVDEGLAVNVAVSGEIRGASGIILKIVVTSVGGDTQTQYVNLWENTKNAD